MYTKIQSAFNYFDYYRKASSGSGHGMHSPFVFEFITKVLRDKKPYPEYARIEGLRKQLLSNHEWLSIVDHGAGSAVDKSAQRTVASIARNAAKPPKFAQLFFRMARKYGAKNILELGSSLGITTAYFAAANPEGSVISIEGAPNLAAMAATHLQQLGLVNGQILTGQFDEVLPDLLNDIPDLDIIFIDGNHQEAATLRYFEMLLPKTHQDSVVIIDDIHWSKGMENAWSVASKHASVRCSIDLFFTGLLFFRNSFHEPVHFAVRF